MAIWILRILFVFVAGGVGVTAMKSPVASSWETPYPFLLFVAILAGAILLVVLDVLIRPKRIDLISCIYFGCVVGLFLSYLFSLALGPIVLDEGVGQTSSLANLMQLISSVALCYICVSMLLQTKDDFRFVIPYVEFAKEVKGLKPFVLDTSVIIDGRIADVVETNLLDSQLLMPRFVLQELQGIADSSDKLRRSRGRRGLDILNKLRSNDKVDFAIFDRELPEMAGQPVDMKLVLLAKHLEGKVVTGDYNLNKVAKLHSVPVINLNEIANALKPVFLPGERVQVRIVKPGEEPGQGVGYLDDGTMIVVENGREHLQQTVEINVTSVLQTSAGRMIFGRFSKELNGESSSTERPS